MTTKTTYHVNINDTDATPDWVTPGRDTITGSHGQDSGRCWLVVETTDPAALEAALDADDDVVEYNTKTTADSITNEQIEALLAEAAEHGDEMQVAYCRLALGGTPMIALNTTPYGARIECARVIEAARAAAE